MLNDILNIANKYAAGVKHVEERREQWLKKHKELRDHLKEIANQLNTEAEYKQGFFIDTLHAFNEDMNGTCADLPSVSFRSGDMPMMVAFHNSMGERKEYTEEGFRITFTPTVTGQVVVLLFPHKSELNKPEPAFTTIAVVDEPEKLTMEIAEKILSTGMKGAFYTSFTGMGEQEEPKPAPKPKSIPHHNPIGFKRYETTEKVK